MDKVMGDVQNSTAEERHWNKVYNYVSWTTGAILLIVLAVFFFPVPVKNEKFVDIGLGILLGILSSNSGTLTGNTPATKKTADVNVSGQNPIIPVNPQPDTNQQSNNPQS